MRIYKTVTNDSSFPTLPETSTSIGICLPIERQLTESMKTNLQRIRRIGELMSLGLCGAVSVIFVVVFIFLCDHSDT